MVARLIGVCEACQGNKHHACADEQTCVCAMRQHPDRTPIQVAANRYMPNPGAA